MSASSQERTALVTGASRGIGRAIAESLAEDGFRVVINYRQNEAAASETRERIADKGGQAIIRQFDVAERDQVTSAIKDLTSDVGPIHVLVNNAAVARLQALVRVKPDDWNYMLDTNARGTHCCTQAVVKAWTGVCPGNRIINITSIGGEQGYRNSSTYAISKAGVIGFTKALAVELAPKQVTVNAVSPGFIETEGAMNAAAGTQLHDDWLAAAPLNRAGRPEEVAHVVRFLASERAAYMTGQVIRVNGGAYM